MVRRPDSECIKLPDGTVKVLVEGTHRAHVVRVTDETVPDAGKKRYAISLSIQSQSILSKVDSSE